MVQNQGISNVGGLRNSLQPILLAKNCSLKKSKSCVMRVMRGNLGPCCFTFLVLDFVHKACVGLIHYVAGQIAELHRFFGYQPVNHDLEQFS